MSSLTICDDNRQEVQSRYIDSIVSRLDFIEIRYLLKEHIDKELSSYSNDDLLKDIISRGTDYINDVFDYGSHDLVVLS